MTPRTTSGPLPGARRPAPLGLALGIFVSAAWGGCERTVTLGVYQGSDGTDGATGSGDGATGAATQGGDTTPGGGTESATTTSAGPTGSEGAGSSTGASPTGGGDTTSAGTTDAIDPCAPEASDDACDVCVKASCCEPLDACADDPLCVCMTSCLAGGSPPQLCAGLCMPGQVYSTYIACLASQCAPQCAP